MLKLSSNSNSRSTQKLHSELPFDRHAPRLRRAPITLAPRQMSLALATPIPGRRTTLNPTAHELQILVAHLIAEMKERIRLERASPGFTIHGNSAKPAGFAIHHL